tara:strand:+ start:652 stop:918 length:267 start_codon:yes stop_codon:yes gene_type:complete
MSDSNTTSTSTNVDETLDTLNQTMNTSSQTAGQLDQSPNNEALQVGDLQLLVNGIHIAQRKGAYSLEESATLFNIIKKVRVTISSQNS